MRQTQVSAELSRLMGNENTQAEAHLINAYKNQYHETIFDAQKQFGVGGSFNLIPDGAVKEVILNPWSGKSFSNRIWEHTDKLIKEARTTLSQGLLQGISNDKMSRRLADRMGVSFSNASRLIRTETNYALNRATLDSYAEADIDKYQYLATLDLRTSQLCRQQDGKVYLLSEAKAGFNLPPLHPNCRSTTVAYFNSEDLSKKQRSAKGADGKYYTVPADMNYEQWYNGHVQPQLKELQKQAQYDKIEETRKSILKGDFNTNVRKQKQLEHIEGTKHWQRYFDRMVAESSFSRPSYFNKDINVQELVDTHKGNGYIEYYGRDKYPREYATHDRNIGWFWDAMNETYMETKRFCIVYSKNGVHLYPVTEMRKSI